jgi:hypothetical protein
MTRSWWVVALAAACGDNHAGAVDAFACTGTELACDGVCVDPQTDAAHCGACDIECQPLGESCIAGHCTDTIASCAQLRAITPTAPDGLYTLIDGSRVYCDMTDGGVTYEALAVGRFDVATTGYDLVTPAELAHAGIQSAFIRLYDVQGGALMLAPFTPGSCCFKFDAGANELAFGGNYLTLVATSGAAACTGLQSDPAYDFDTVAPGNVHTVQAPPLAASFFTSAPATGATDQCPDDSNPAFFFKRHT